MSLRHWVFGLLQASWFHQRDSAWFGRSKQVLVAWPNQILMIYLIGAHFKAIVLGCRRCHLVVVLLARSLLNDQLVEIFPFLVIRLSVKANWGSDYGITLFPLPLRYALLVWRFLSEHSILWVDCWLHSALHAQRLRVQICACVWCGENWV